MLNRLKLWWKEKKNGRLYKPEIEKLRAQGKGEEADSLIAEYSQFAQEIDEEKSYLYQSRLKRKARRLQIEVPGYTQAEIDAGTWEEFQLIGMLLLTVKGERKLLEEIRKEQNARRDRIIGWIAPFSNIIIALIGAVAGFFLGKLSK
jgi:HSP20 family molecular chaperone IbpA